MALQSSGAISLDDMHVELGESSGTQVSINDTDVRGLIDKGDGVSMSFNEWYGASAVTYVNATGGTTTTSGNYRYHYFNSSGTLNITEIGTGGASNVIDYIIIAGGASGAKGFWYNYSPTTNDPWVWTGGGGGAGGYRTGTFNATVGNKTVTVGSGGASVPNSANHSYAQLSNNGGDSSISGVVTSTGGGGGGYMRYDGRYQSTYTLLGNAVQGKSGGSGGGMGIILFGSSITVDGVLTNNANTNIGGAGISGQGHNGSRNDYGSNYAAGRAGSGGGAGGVPPAPHGVMQHPVFGSYPNFSYSSNTTYAQDGGPGSNAGSANYNGATRAGGGGGGIWAWYNTDSNGSRFSEGGSGGGGRGARKRYPSQSGGGYTAAQSGTANTGSGGGGGLYSQASGAGGSGIVMIRYQYQG